MGGAKCVPDHDVLIFYRAVLRDIFWQAVAAGMLVRELAARIAFVGRIARDPKVLGRKAATRGHVTVFLRQHHGCCMYHELVARRPADAVGRAWIDDLPVTSGTAIGLTGGVLLARQRSR